MVITPTKDEGPQPLLELLDTKPDQRDGGGGHTGLLSTGMWHFTPKYGNFQNGFKVNIFSR